MVDIKTAMADVEKCVKAGDTLSNCVKKADEKYHLTKDQKSKIRQAMAKKKD